MKLRARSPLRDSNPIWRWFAIACFAVLVGWPDTFDIVYWWWLRHHPAVSDQGLVIGIWCAFAVGAELWFVGRISKTCQWVTLSGFAMLGYMCRTRLYLVEGVPLVAARLVLACIIVVFLAVEFGPPPLVRQPEDPERPYDQGDS